MATDPTFTRNTQIRLEKIEEGMTLLWERMHHIINKDQFNRLSVLFQQNYADVVSRLETCESWLQTLQEDVDNNL